MKVAFKGYSVASNLVDAVGATIDAHAKDAALVIKSLGAKMNDLVEQQSTVTIPEVVKIVKAVQIEAEKIHEGAWKASSDPAS